VEEVVEERFHMSESVAGVVLSFFVLLVDGSREKRAFSRTYYVSESPQVVSDLNVGFAPDAGRCATLVFFSAYVVVLFWTLL